MKFHVVIQAAGFKGQLERDVDAADEDDAFASIAEQIGQLKESDCDITITPNARRQPEQDSVDRLHTDAGGWNGDRPTEGAGREARNARAVRKGDLEGAG